MPRWFPFALALGILAGCQGNPNLISYGVYGYVENAATGHRVSGIDVTFTADTLRTGSDETDGDGRYEIVVESDTAFGHLTATDSAGRFSTEIVEVYFDEETRRVDIELGPAPTE